MGGTRLSLKDFNAAASSSHSGHQHGIDCVEFKILLLEKCADNPNNPVILHIDNPEKLSAYLQGTLNPIIFDDISNNDGHISVQDVKGYISSNIDAQCNGDAYLSGIVKSRNNPTQQIENYDTLPIDYGYDFGRSVIEDGKKYYDPYSDLNYRLNKEIMNEINNTTISGNDLDQLFHIIAAKYMTPDIAGDHMLTERQSIAEIRPGTKDNARSSSSINAFTFPQAPSPQHAAPKFMREINLLDANLPANQAQPIRYAISDDGRIEFSRAAHGRWETLDVPVAQLPDGRMVASLGGYIVRPNGQSDNVADALEITWSPTRNGSADNPFAVQIQGFWGGATPDAARVRSGTLDIDGDGAVDSGVAIARNTYEFANRSLSSESGMSRYPDGWDTSKPLAEPKERVAITLSSIGKPVN